ncbi:family 78 glycoside hydrolase catalytic domain [Labilibacter marinus]|uniref:family 78 glycoside hydrolase catalytic domain n=1 Tax=Labilibacter marinus TaxID=1477105 RepID=UPI00082C126F|nr:family 78 glycoside hydrolase catalytic domain [Labilibacter marinus]
MLYRYFTLSFLLLFLSTSFYGQSLEFKSLTCNSQSNPIAIDNQSPLFSWVVKSEGFNRSQTAYQVLVASEKELLQQNEADLWNSSKVNSSQSAFVRYQGAKLHTLKKYYWKVKIWDESGIESNWSPVNSFEMGLLVDSDWGNSKWITLSNDTRTSEYRFRDYNAGHNKPSVKVTSQAVGYFRGMMNAEKKVKSARAYICGLGYYELYINGKKTGDHVLDPAPSNYDKQAYYITYDVTDQIKTGENAVGVILGNGFYGQSISWKRDPESERDLSYGAPTARILIKLTYEDNTEAEFYSNENWKNSTGPIVFDNVYGGDTYDARFEINGWNTVDYNDKKWTSVKIISPNLNKVSANQMPTIRKLKEFEPQRVFKSVKGNWVVDFGQNIAGWVKINVKEKKGKVINIKPTEALTQLGDDIYPGSTGGGANGMPQLYTYICKGNGLESWEPKFSYHGFRYAEITGVSTKPDADMIRAVLVATDVEQTGSFSCSDPLYNKMDTISKWTIIDNLHGIPEDCPHREKCGWLGDAHAFCEYALYNYDLGNFYKKYMEDIRTQFKTVNGNNKSGEKFRVPTMIAPGKRTSSIAKLDWGVATMYLPWYNYIYYGDSSIVVEYYDDMKELTNYYLTFKNEKGIIDNGMGDWCPPRWDRKRNPLAMECHPVVSANAYFYDILGIMKAFAVMNKDEAFEAKMEAEQEELFIAFNKEYLKAIPMTPHSWYGSQTATVMALQFGMVPKEKIQTVVDGLSYNIVAVKGVHHAVGIHGNRYIYTVLNKYDKADLAHQILTTPTFPSQTYVMNYGFTTWPERQFFWEDMEGLSNSLNHPMHSGFAAYFFESLGGIKTSYEAVGYKEFDVNPVFQKEITQTTVSVPTPYGNINNNWNIDDSQFSMQLTVPFNTKAKLTLTANELETLSINGINWVEYKKKNNIDLVNGALKLGSGKYLIKYNK